jgi:hypothetical protein
MAVKNRILEYLKRESISRNRFYSSTGLSNGFLDKGENIGTDKVERICKTYPDINVEWLVLGEGPMLKTNDEIERSNDQSLQINEKDKLITEKKK